MRLSINGEERELPAGTTVADVVASLDLPAGPRGVAVAVDAEVVPQSAWGHVALGEGAQVEVLHAVQGG